MRQAIWRTILPFSTTKLYKGSRVACKLVQVVPSCANTVKSRQSAPTFSTLQVGRGGWMSPTCRIQCYMKKYSPYENCSCISYTDQRSRARSRTDPTKRRVWRVCAIPVQEGGHCCVHFQRGRARVCSTVRHHRLRQSPTRIQSITSLTRSQGGADGRDRTLWRDFTVLW